MNTKRVLAISFAISYFLYKNGEMEREEYLQISKKANKMLDEKVRRRAIRFVAKIIKEGEKKNKTTTSLEGGEGNERCS